MELPLINNPYIAEGATTCMKNLKEEIPIREPTKIAGIIFNLQLLLANLFVLFGF